MLILVITVLLAILGCGIAAFYYAYRAIFVADTMFGREIGLGLFLAGCGSIAFALVAAGVLMLTDDHPVYTLSVSGWACTASHQESGVSPMIVGKTTMMMPYTNTVCDQYSRKTNG